MTSTATTAPAPEEQPKKKVVAKERNKKLTVAKKRYFIPKTGKVYQAASLSEASTKAQKELDKENK